MHTKKYLVVMNNVFRDLEVSDIFDLKGSTQGRRTLPKGMPFDDPARDQKIALKDLDFLDNI